MKKGEIIKKIFSFFLASLFSCGLFFAVYFIGLAKDDEAGTIIVADGCNIKISVKIAFAFLDDSVADADLVVEKWMEGIRKIWGGDFVFGDKKCPVKFEFKEKILGKGQVCSDISDLKGWHCVDVVSERVHGSSFGRAALNKRGNVADVFFQTNKTSAFGEWTFLTSSLDAAHLVGHLLGLVDEYEYLDNSGDAEGDTFLNNNKQPEGRIQSIMAQTWGKVGALNSHVNTIIEKAGVSCPAYCCCDDGNCRMGQEKCAEDEESDGCGCKKKSAVASSTLENYDNSKDYLFSVSPEVLNFGFELEDMTFRVTNTSGQSISWKIFENLPDWLEIDLMSGDLKDGETIVRVKVNRSKVQAGFYAHSLIVSAENSEGKSVYITMISK